MKITVIGQSMDERTGGGILMSSVVQAIKDDGHTINIWSSDINLPRSKIGVAKKIWTIRKDARESDFVHAFDLYPYGIIAFLASLGTGAKLIITLIGTGSVQKLQFPFWRVILGVVLNRAHGVVAISRFIGEKVREYYTWLRYAVINPGVFVDEWENAKTAKPNALPEGLRFMLSVGSMKRRKGHDVLIRAFSRLRGHEDLCLVIVSNPSQGAEYYRELENLILEMGLRGRVFFLPNISIEEKKWLFKNCVMFALASRVSKGDLEGFGIVFLEAAVNGKISVGSSRTGAEDAILDGKSGFLVSDSENVDEWVSDILRVLDDSDIRATMSVEAYKWAKLNDRRLMTKKYVEFYKKLQS